MNKLQKTTHKFHLKQNSMSIFILPLCSRSLAKMVPTQVNILTIFSETNWVQVMNLNPIVILYLLGKQ